MGDNSLEEILLAENVKGNIGDAVEQKETLCDEVETVWESSYLEDRVSAVRV